jgi:hypothetical protein
MNSAYREIYIERAMLAIESTSESEHHRLIAFLLAFARKYPKRSRLKLVVSNK